MTNRLRAFYITLLTISFVALFALPRAAADPTQGKRRGRRCTAAVLAALKPTPELDYECAAQQDDNLKSEARQAALKDYLRQLEEIFNNDVWWATSIEELNACAITKEARVLSKDESREFAFNISLYGDHSTRLISVVDPCIAYSYRTLNAYILQRVGRRVVATQVLDAFFTRFDASLDMDVAQLDGERLIIIERNEYGGGPVTMTTTADAYTINPRTHRPQPKKMFKQGGKLTNEIAWEAPPFFDSEVGTLPADGWREPLIVSRGRLAPRFRVAHPTKRGLRYTTYRWTGKYYQPAR
ncbi:MAG TPA: hypothetical protein VKA60_04025 [Blastocatellia bacterium]|nr:hypothetical protein [Blastocatellia bacterium]